MKTLVVVRHAKSSWDYPQLADSERPLNKRGLRNAPEMGKRLASKGFSVDRIYSSRARRALTTAEMISKEIDYPSSEIIISELLYHTLDEEMLELIRSFNSEDEKVMIFGHNPGFTDLVNYLTGSDIYNVPTAGIATIEFDINSWQEVKPTTGRLANYDYPKKRND